MIKKELFFISREKEWELIQQILTNVDNRDFDPDDTCILMVSPDYSATFAMVLSHAWSFKGRIIPIIPVDVPYPTENYRSFKDKFLGQKEHVKKYKKLICVEAGIIRGSNWVWLLDVITKDFGYDRKDVTLVAMCENVHSKVKSDYVGEYYDNEIKELTFYFEKFNKNWI
jgi:hypothetical protein